MIPWTIGHGAVTTMMLRVALAVLSTPRAGPEIRAATALRRGDRGKRRLRSAESGSSQPPVAGEGIILWGGGEVDDEAEMLDRGPVESGPGADDPGRHVLDRGRDAVP